MAGMSDFLRKSDGQIAQRVEQYENTRVDYLPKGTRVTAFVENVGWRPLGDGLIKHMVEKEGFNREDVEQIDSINIMFRVCKGPHENFVLFHELNILDLKPDRRDEAIQAYSALDTHLNAGLLLEYGQEPSDEELAQAWGGKKVDLVLGTRKIKGTTDYRNYIQGIYAADSAPSVSVGGEGRQRRSATASAPAAAAAPARRRSAPAAAQTAAPQEPAAPALRTRRRPA